MIRIPSLFSSCSALSRPASILCLGACVSLSGSAFAAASASPAAGGSTATAATEAQAPATADAQQPQSDERVSLWLDMYRTEPLPFEAMSEDLAQADIVYLGETHTLRRHHYWQTRILEALSKDSPRKAVLGLEQIEHIHQKDLDDFNSGSIDFDELAERINWKRSWSNYTDYRELVEAARENGVTVLALNAPAASVRKIGRQGIDALDATERAQFPAQMRFDDPAYRQLLGLMLKGMAHMKDSDGMMERINQAQISRDEHMAETLANFLKQHPGYRAIVLTGSGHIAYGLGTADRVRERLPELSDRIVLMSVSGELELTEQQKAFAGDSKITHEDLLFLARPKANYLQLTEPKE